MGSICDICKDEDGSFTLESAIILPVVIFTICLSVYMALAMFEQAQLQAASGYAAANAAAGWRGAGAGGAGLYDRIFFTYGEEKPGGASAAALARFSETGLAGYAKVDAYAAYKNGIFAKTVTVALNGYINMPNKNVAAFFGLKNSFGGGYGSISLLPDFAEDIRCADYAMEIEKRLEEASPEFAKAANSFSEILAHIQGYIGGLLS